MFHIFVFELSHFPAILADGRITCLHFVSCISDRIRDRLPAAQSGSVGFSNFGNTQNFERAHTYLHLLVLLPTNMISRFKQAVSGCNWDASLQNPTGKFGQKISFKLAVFAN